MTNTHKTLPLFFSLIFLSTSIFVLFQKFSFFMILKIVTISQSFFNFFFCKLILIWLIYHFLYFLKYRLHQCIARGKAKSSFRHNNTLLNEKEWYPSMYYSKSLWNVYFLCHQVALLYKDIKKKRYLIKYIKWSYSYP